jgi:hypothetical protein
LSTTSGAPTGRDADLERARHDVAALRHELASLRARRVVRVGLMLAELLRRPWRLWRLPWLLVEALRPVELPPPPRRPSSGTRRAARRGLWLAPPAQRARYPHVRVGHLGSSTPYEDLASHVRLRREGWEEQIEEGLDVLYVVSPEPGWPLEEITARCREASVPTLLALDDPRDLELLEHRMQPDLLVTDDRRAAASAAEHVDEARILGIEPATDLRLFNPVGWQREPPDGVMLVVARQPQGGQLDTLRGLIEACDPDVSVCVTPGVDAEELSRHTGGRSIRALSGPAALAGAARDHRVALTHPDLHATPAAHVRHVLEVLACGTPVIHPADGTLARLLPPHLRHEASDPGDLRGLVAALSAPDRRERTSIPSRRHVLSNHTTIHRFDEILTALGVPTAAVPTISVLFATRRADFLEHAHAEIARQDYPSLQIITVCHGDGFDRELLERVTAQHDHPTVTLHAPARWTLGDALNLGLDHATGELITKMDDDDYYGPSHLTDLHLALTYSRADVVGKLANFVYLSERDITIDRYLEHEESHVWHLPGATILTHREVLEAYRFSRVRRAVDTALYTRIHEDGARRYSTHRFNFIRYRGGQHTYARTDEHFLEQAEHTYGGLPRDRTEL